jgi:predicted helicase
MHTYIQSLERELSAGDTTEHTHRTAFKILLESLNTDIIATNEPQHITAVGAPDFRIIKNKLAIGYVECKDIGKNLDEALETDQLKRYLHSFHNLLLTDYLEFRWYVGGKLRLKKTLGTLVKNKIKQDKDSLQDVADGLIAFLNNEPEPIGSPKELAGHMARLAHMIREIIINALKKELVTGSLHAQWQAFRENLIPDLSVEQFADMYAQTIAYGLFAARCETDNGKDFTRQQAAYLIPKTNPFLRKLFNYIAGPELDESITWAVDDLAQILAWADMEAVLKDFGKSTGKADPVVHFYETFLKEYDPKTREMRGVYYTPLPVVSYIVRSIDHILKTSFDKPQGLADPSVLVLDPAVGTATFLYMVMQEIHEAIIKQGQTGTWDEYVAKKLLPRLFGFEILMAPYAIAHLKLGRLLKETGYQFQTDQRLGIYLTNTLEEAIKHADTMFAQWITEEANAAADIKKTKPIMVVLGNPPYSVNSVNKGKWINELLKDYKSDLNETKLNLDDDYIKFIRFAQWRIDQTGYGILGFITNNSYLDGITHRRIREYLLKSFSEIYILNLHGNLRRKENTPENSQDQNVFNVMVGVSIGIFIKNKDGKPANRIHYADLWGLRDNKYEVLSETSIKSTNWLELTPAKPNYFFTNKDSAFQNEYFNYYSLKNMFVNYGPSIKTERDKICIHIEKESLITTLNDFLYKSEEEIRTIYSLDNDSRDWKVSSAKADICNNKLNDDLIFRITYRPFDDRYTYFTGKSRGFIGTPGTQVMSHMLSGNNISLITNRTINTKNVQHFFVSNKLVDYHVLETANATPITFPLYLYPRETKVQKDKSGGREGGTMEPLKLQEKRELNLNLDFVNIFSKKLGLKFNEDGKSDLLETFGPEDVFNYAYAVFHSPEYRSRYVEFLKIDFPCLPLTSDKELFSSLAEKGAVLVALHLMESPLLNNLITKYPVKGEHLVEKVSYDEKTQRVSINKAQYFEGVPPEVWNFHIGGYQVCEKWLKDRKGRKRTIDDINHFQKIVVALKETIRLMGEIDQTIEEHGGWPAAFA